MSPKLARRLTRAVVMALIVAAPVWIGAQDANAVATLRVALAERFDLVPLQGGVALVPRSDDVGVRLVQVVGGVVSIDGVVATGEELATRLGDDAPLVVQLSYLTPDVQRALAVAPNAIPADSTLTPPAPPGPPDRPLDRAVRGPGRGDRVRFGGGVLVRPGEDIEGDAVAIFGPLRVDGTVRGDAVSVFGGGVVNGEVGGDLVAVMGGLRLGPNAVIGGDVVAVGGRLARAPTAVVGGSVQEVDFLPRVVDGTGWRQVFAGMLPERGGLVPTIVRALLLVLVGLIVVAVGQTSIERVAQQVKAEPVRSGLVGLLAEVLFVPVLVVTVILLAVSIIGIPAIVLVPFGVLLVVLLMLIGFSAMAYALGGAVMRRFRGAQNTYVAVVIGVVAILGVTLFARMMALSFSSAAAPLVAAGFVLEFVAWTIGFGAVILALVDARRRRVLTPAPPPSSPTASV